MILVSSNQSENHTFLNNLKSEFEMTVLDSINYLGLIVERNRGTHEMIIHQSKYLQEVMKRFNMTKCKGISTPVDKGLHLSKAEFEEEISCKPYRELVGSLMYLMVGSRPDICFSLYYFCKFQDQVTAECFNQLKRILRYLSHTKMLTYNKYECENIYGFVDAD